MWGYYALQFEPSTSTPPREPNFTERVRSALRLPTRAAFRGQAGDGARDGGAAPAQRAQRHEIASALAALEAAATALMAHDGGSPVERRLSQALRAEVQRLRELLVRPVGHVATPSDDERLELRGLLDALTAVESAQGTHVRLRAPERIEVLGRSAAVTQIVQTLFDNARRHAPGSPVDVTVTEARHAVHLEVADRGPGVPQWQRQRIFEVGARGGAATDGDGLGLALARRTARTMSGNVWVRPRPGGGSVFVVELLPTALRPPTPEAVPALAGRA